MKKKYCDFEFLYKGYNLIDNIIRALEVEAQPEQKQVIELKDSKILDEDFIKWYKNITSKQSFDRRVLNARNSIDAILTTMRCMEGMQEPTVWSIRFDRFKAFLRGKYKMRSHFLNSMANIMTDVSSRLNALDGGIEENGAYLEDLTPLKEQISTRRNIGF